MRWKQKNPLKQTAIEDIVENEIQYSKKNNLRKYPKHPIEIPENETFEFVGKLINLAINGYRP